MNLSKYFLLFLIYAFIGWVLEGISIFLDHKKVVNRGFLIGPYCPIYGVGGILITILLKESASDPLSLFLKSIVICAFLEYFTGYILEKIFRAKWWDYSDRKYNINGYVCLENLVLFGIGACFTIYIINPFFIKLLIGIPNNITQGLAIYLLIVFIVDMIISIKVVASLKSDYKQKKQFAIEGVPNKDVKKVLREKSVLYRRLMDSFPPIRKSFVDAINKLTK